MDSPTIIYASAQKDTFNEICERAGIETIQKEGCKPLWRYQGKVYPRPEHVQQFEAKLLEYFNIQVQYRDENQLTIF